MPISALFPKEFAANLKAGLADVGQDAELLSIQDAMADKLGDVASLDVANLSPAQLEATFSAVEKAAEDGVNSLLAKAEELKPQMISLQSELANQLSGLASELGDGLGAAMPAGFDLDSMTSDFTAGFELPSLSGLDAGISSLAGNLSDAAKDAGNLLSDPTTGALSVAKKLNFNAADAGLPSLADIGLPTGADFGKSIPNLQMMKVPVFDVDGVQIGEEIKTFKQAIAATMPVVDDINDENSIPFQLKKVSEIISNPLFKDNGLLVASGRSAINSFNEAISTAISFDEGTGENIVWEGIEGPDGEEVTVSGFASYEEFAAAYKQERAAAKGKIKEALGGLNEAVGQFTKLAQASAKELSKVVDSEFVIPTPPADFIPTLFRKIGIDATTGAAVSIEEVPSDAIQDVNADDDLFDAGGLPVKPGEDAEKFLKEAKEKVQTDFKEFQKGLNSLFKGKSPSLPGSVRPPSSLN